MQTGFFGVMSETENWIYHRFQVADNIQQSTANIGLGSFFEEKNLLTDRV